MTAPRSIVHQGDFFAWAKATDQRFDAVGGNPPFIRYQHFAGAMRAEAAALSRDMGAEFSGLASSWAPFVVVAAGLLKPGGRLAFVVPAEIGHATYARPLVESLCSHFDRVTVLAVRHKLFPELSEDAWILYAEGYGASTTTIGLAVRDRLEPGDGLPQPDRLISLAEWRLNQARLRRYVLPDDALRLYDDLRTAPGVSTMAELAKVGIGYVSGANDFFHLAPSRARDLGIPEAFLRVTVRKGDQLPSDAVDARLVAQWLRRDLPVLLLDLSPATDLPRAIRRYLESPDAHRARQRYKCRVRDPWYVVPGIMAPDGFLSYMSGIETALARNEAGCVCTNSVHAVRLRDGFQFRALQHAWQHPLSRLSQELEGHPLGGGLLKLEPREAGRVLVPLEPPPLSSVDANTLREGIDAARRWRHVV